jgi:hypothetical protein
MATQRFGRGRSKIKVSIMIQERNILPSQVVTTNYFQYSCHVFRTRFFEAFFRSWRSGRQGSVPFLPADIGGQGAGATGSMLTRI